MLTSKKGEKQVIWILSNLEINIDRCTTNIFHFNQSIFYSPGAVAPKRPPPAVGKSRDMECNDKAIRIKTSISQVHKDTKSYSSLSYQPGQALELRITPLPQGQVPVLQITPLPWERPRVLQIIPQRPEQRVRVLQKVIVLR